MPHAEELNLVRRQLDGLEYARLTDSTPARDARHQELCQREVLLLGRQALTRTGRSIALSLSESSRVE